MTVSKLQLVYVLPYRGKSLLYLRTGFRRKIEKNILFCQLNVVFRSTCRLGILFRFKYFLQQKILTEIVYIIRAVTARLLTTKKHFDIFLLERQSTWEFRIKRENVLETLKSWQYQTTCGNMNVL